MFTVIALAGAAMSAPPADLPADLKLTEASLAAWKQELQPSDSERGWSAIPWHPSFADGLQAADAAGRPLLLWAMNGHPLGCT